MGEQVGKFSYQRHGHGKGSAAESSCMSMKNVIVPIFRAIGDKHWAERERKGSPFQDVNLDCGEVYVFL